MLSRFNEKVQKSIALAESLAFDFGHNSVGTEHLLLALLKIKESKLRVILEEHHLTYEIFKLLSLNMVGEAELKTIPLGENLRANFPEEIRLQQIPSLK